MGSKSSIEWTDATFNPWWGCVKVSPACAHCYAETFAKRVGQRVWGADAPRRFFGDKHWAEPVKWNREAREAGVRRRVFCASMADVFEDRRDLDAQRARLWDLIEATSDLDWLLLTKRPELMTTLAPERWAKGWPWNIIAMTTVENQEMADLRVDQILRVPAARRGLSMEPLLGPVDLFAVGTKSLKVNALNGGWAVPRNNPATYRQEPRIHWVIVGSESGHGARPMETAWARALVDQCRAAGVACFTKQIANAKDRKGGDPAHWPPGNWPREFPESAASVPL